jgi:hypothetical protein
MSMLRKSDLMEQLDTIESDKRTEIDVRTLAEYMGYQVFHNADGWYLAEQTSIDPKIYDVYGPTYPSLQEFKKYVLGLKQKKDEHTDRMAEQRYYEQQMEQGLSPEGEHQMK